jgi:hypothetical protein
LSYVFGWLSAVAVLNVLAQAGVFCVVVCYHGGANKEKTMSE